MTPIAIVPPTAVLLYPAPIKPNAADADWKSLTADQRLWNERARAFNKGRLR